MSPEPNNSVAMTKASRATATRDLQDLVGKGALTRRGQLRFTRYALNWLLLFYKPLEMNNIIRQTNTIQGLSIVTPTLTMYAYNPR